MLSNIVPLRPLQWTHLTTRVCCGTADVLVNANICSVGVIRPLHRFLHMGNKKKMTLCMQIFCWGFFCLFCIGWHNTQSTWTKNQHILFLRKPGRLETEPRQAASGWFRIDWPLFSDSNCVRSWHSLVRGSVKWRRHWERKMSKWDRQIKHLRVNVKKNNMTHLHIWGLVCRDPRGDCHSGRRT